MKRQLFILLLLSVVLVGCSDKKTAVNLPTFSDMSVSPAKTVYAVNDTVQCSITMLTPGDVSLKKATYWFYASWWGSDPNMTADFCTPDTIDGVVSFHSSKIVLSQPGDVTLYFWGRLEYPNWNFQPITIPVMLHVE